MTLEEFEKTFPIVEASKLSFEDDFMTHIPQTGNEILFKRTISNLIKSGMQDFRHSTVDPSLSKDGNVLEFKAKNKVKVNETPVHWRYDLYRFMHEKNSRMGKVSEYYAYLAVIIKELIKSGYSINNAWNAVCNDSKELGHYSNSKNSKRTFEETGNRQVGIWHDLANTCKILQSNDEQTFFSAGGSYIDNSIHYPLMSVLSIGCPEGFYRFNTGWIVFPK